MVEVILGVVLTAVLGGLLIPALKNEIDWHRERLAASVELVELLAASLWTYWKLALRVAYYGSKGPARARDLAVALERWDSDEAWANGGQIQIQVSRSKRLLPDGAHGHLDAAQQAVVDYLDMKVDELREKPDTKAWGKFYVELMGAKRTRIDSLLATLTEDLYLARQSWYRRWWHRIRNRRAGTSEPDTKYKEPVAEAGESEGPAESDARSGG